MTPRIAIAFFSLVVLSSCADTPPYQYCSVDQPCSGDARLCLSNTSAGGTSIRFCSARCETPAANSSECPGNGACVRLNGGSPVCMAKCAVVGDCAFPNAVCVATGESMGVRICTVQ